MQKAADLHERGNLERDCAFEALLEVVLGKVGGLCDYLGGDVRVADDLRDVGCDVVSSLCHKGNVTLPQGHMQVPWATFYCPGDRRAATLCACQLRKT